MLRSAVVALTVLLTSSGLAAESADELAEHYAAARGGLAAWRAVEGMEWTGIYATFSQSHPFVARWQRPELFRMEGRSLGGPFVFAHDSAGPWFIFPAIDITEAARPAGPFAGYGPMLARDALLEPPLMAYKEKGHRLELVGPADLDGQPAVALKLTLANGWEETWYLDPKTHLELAIDATVWDFTQTDKPMKRRSFFSDFRKVGDLLLPHRIEQEYGARFALMMIEKVALDSKLDAGLFTMPAPPPATP